MPVKPLGALWQWDPPGRQWVAPGREPVYGGTDPGTRPFVIGVDEPTRDNTGVGTDGFDYPTAVVNSNVKVLAGQVYENRVINGWVNVQVGGTLRNCLVRGAGQPTDGRPLVMVDIPDGWNGTDRAVIDHCTLQPTTGTRSSGYSVGVGIKGFTCTRTKILDCIDGFTVSGNATAPSVTIQGCYVSDMMTLSPDPWGRWPGTHNDVVQLHGSKAYYPPENLYVFGNGFDCYPSSGSNVSIPAIVDGSAQVSYADIMISVPTGTFNSILLEKNWLRGANQELNAVAQSTCSITATGNRWTRGTADGGSPPDGLPYVAAYIDSSYTLVWDSSNVWMDGGPATPVIRG